jgi:phage tail sheath protein FI
MPVTPTYPGVYIEEIPSGVRTITGVATSITAFIGRVARGPADKAVRIQSFADYTRVFGGLWSESTVSYAVQHFFLHGGADTYIVRVHNSAGSAAISLPTAGDPLVLEAIGPGTWGNALRASVNYEATKDPANLFTLTIQELDAPGSTTVVTTETFINLSSAPTDPRYVTTVLAEESRLATVQGTAPTDRPTATIINADDPADSTKYVAADGAGDDGGDITDTEIADDTLKASRSGIFALDAVDLFNMLCIPPLTRTTDVDATATLAKAAKYCKDRRAVLIVDSPSRWVDTTAAESGINTMRGAIGTDLSDHVATYFPRIMVPDPLKENRTDTFAPCGAIAGIIARTDTQRGVWKAPAGLEASFVGVRALSYKLNDGENGRLNPLGLNCLRNFAVFGNVVWGGRTLAGADQLGSEWKYLPVRRTALFIEESLYRGTQWVVFEPNDEPLWAQIRLNVGAFMHNLFRQGAFQGTTPRDAYFVKCDKETTTQNDINLGIVNIVVGFAPLKPAEFVIIKLQQMAGQIQV